MSNGREGARKLVSEKLRERLVEVVSSCNLRAIPDLPLPSPVRWLTLSRPAVPFGKVPPSCFYIGSRSGNVGHG